MSDDLDAIIRQAGDVAMARETRHTLTELVRACPAEDLEVLAWLMAVAQGASRSRQFFGDAGAEPPPAMRWYGLVTELVARAPKHARWLDAPAQPVRLMMALTRAVRQAFDAPNQEAPTP